MVVFGCTALSYTLNILIYLFNNIIHKFIPRYEDTNTCNLIYSEYSTVFKRVFEVFKM